MKTSAHFKNRPFQVQRREANGPLVQLGGLPFPSGVTQAALPWRRNRLTQSTHAGQCPSKSRLNQEIRQNKTEPTPPQRFTQNKPPFSIMIMWPNRA